MIARVFNSYLPLSGVLLCLILVGLASTADAGGLYKWVDENGEVRYTDRMPQSAASKQSQTLNDQGVVISTKEAAKTAEEQAALEKIESERKERLDREKRQKEEQRKNDQALLLTFSSERELAIAKEERMEVLDSVIRLIYKSIADTSKKLDQFESLADKNYISKGLPVPGGLAQNIEVLTRKNFIREKQLRNRLSEKNTIETQYEIDLARFRTLTD
jgi:Domain of unknown function (DUF4124)